MFAGIVSRSARNTWPRGHRAWRPKRKAVGGRRRAEQQHQHPQKAAVENRGIEQRKKGCAPAGAFCSMAIHVAADRHRLPIRMLTVATSSQTPSVRLAGRHLSKLPALLGAVTVFDAVVAARLAEAPTGDQRSRLAMPSLKRGSSIHQLASPGLQWSGGYHGGGQPLEASRPARSIPDQATRRPATGCCRAAV